jgi:uncharacterized protein
MARLLLIFVIVFLLVALWRTSRRPPSSTSKSDAPGPAQQEDMVRCRQCGLHLPSSEAVQGQAGVYCCHEHRAAAER